MRRKYIILIIVLSIGGILFFQNLYQERKDKEIKQLADKIEKQKTELEKHFIDYFPKELSDSFPIVLLFNLYSSIVEWSGGV